MDFYRGFKAPSDFAQEHLFYIDALGHLKSEDFIIDRVGFNNYLVMYVLSGKLHVEQNGHYILNENEGVIMRLMDRHKYYTDATDICEILWIHINGWQVEGIMKLIEQKCMMPAIFYEARVAELIRRCFTLYQDVGSQREFRLSETVYSIMLTILHSVYRDEVFTYANEQTVFINRAARYVDDNIYEKITLQDFANQFNFSRFHFSRVFEKYFKMPPMKYVAHTKVKHSQYLLAYTHESISSIAGKLGFVDQSHFSKVFKAVVNQAPLAFRKGGKL